MITIRSVQSNKELDAFIQFPHDLYEGDSNYVPALYLSEKELLTKHPFHLHSEMQLFLAYENDKVVGRIAGIHNRNYIKFTGKSIGFFGFFESINHFTVAEALFNAVKSWLKDRNLFIMHGPVNPSTNESCGLLMEGFDSPPVMMMPYNPPYYLELFEQAGLEKEVDLIAYDIRTAKVFDKTYRLIDAIVTRLHARNITVRSIDTKRFDQEVEGILEVYNRAWDKNLGFVPMTPEEFRHMAKDLKMILDKDFTLVAEHEGKIVGFALGVPDLNQAQIHVKRGKLFPFGLFKLLYYKRKIDYYRVLTLGVVEEYRKLGIEAVLYGKIIQNGKRKNLKGAEASWILEGNDMMNKAILNINGDPYKKYRIYKTEI